MKKYWIGFLFIILAFSWIAVIYYFSNQNGAQSSAVSNSVTSKALRLFVPQYGEFPIEEQRIIYRRFSLFVRKMAHFMEYFCLAFFLFCGCIFLFKKDWLAYLVSCILVIVIAIGDEIHQYFVEGRVAMIQDVIIDVLGALVMFGLIAVFRQIYKKRKMVKRND